MRPAILGGACACAGGEYSCFRCGSSLLARACLPVAEIPSQRPSPKGWAKGEGGLGENPLRAGGWGCVPCRMKFLSCCIVDIVSAGAGMPGRKAADGAYRQRGRVRRRGRGRSFGDGRLGLYVSVFQTEGRVKESFRLEVVMMSGGPVVVVRIRRGRAASLGLCTACLACDGAGKGLSATTELQDG